MSHPAKKLQHAATNHRSAFKLFYLEATKILSLTFSTNGIDITLNNTFNERNRFCVLKLKQPNVGIE